MDDKSLVESARRGDRGAFETLVKRYEAKVYHLAYGFVQDRATADDLAQDVFVKVYLPSGQIPRSNPNSAPGSTASPSTISRTTCARSAAGRKCPSRMSPRAGSAADDPVRAGKPSADRGAADGGPQGPLDPAAEIPRHPDPARRARAFLRRDRRRSEDLARDRRLPAAPGPPACSGRKWRPSWLWRDRASKEGEMNCREAERILLLSWDRPLDSASSPGWTPIGGLSPLPRPGRRIRRPAGTACGTCLRAAPRPYFWTRLNARIEALEHPAPLTVWRQWCLRAIPVSLFLIGLFIGGLIFLPGRRRRHEPVRSPSPAECQSPRRDDRLPG